MPDRPAVILVTDGSCLGNLGPGGWAAILQAQGTEKVLTGSDPQTTNNRMELTAVLRGLQALRRPCAVTLVADSQYVLKGLTDWLAGWRTAARRPVENQDLWEALAAVLAPHTVTPQWVPGHTGHPLNERVNALALAAAREAAPTVRAPGPRCPPRGPGRVRRGGGAE